MKTWTLKWKQMTRVLTSFLAASVLTTSALAAASKCEDALGKDSAQHRPSRRDEAPTLDSAGKLSLKDTPTEQWSALAQKEIQSLGDVIGIDGGVTKAPVRNQREGEDCWSYSISTFIESFLKKLNFTIKLSPEYNEVWHIYYQLETHLPNFAKVAKKLKANPTDPDLQQKLNKLTATYSKHVRAHSLKYSDDGGTEIFQPDVGNEAPTAIREISRFGLAPFRVFRTVIKTADDEKKLEAQINALVSQMIQDEVTGKTALSEYKETAPDQINEKLFQLLAGALDPIYKVQMIQPTDKWSFDGQDYTPLSLLAKVAALGMDLRKNLRTFTATPETHETSLKAIAIALLQTNLPVPIGISMLSDKVNADGKTVTDFAEQTGLFTSSVCPGGPCQSEDGSHEISVVNFIAKSTDPSIKVASLSPQEKIDLINQGKLKITGLIIQNSWGPSVGLDANGRTPPNLHRGGYYVITADYLLNSGLPPINDMYDFVLPADIAALFPSLKRER